MIFDLKKYSQKYAFEDEEGNKITYGEIEALSEKIRKKIGTRKLVCILSNNTIGALLYYIALLCSDNVVMILDDSIPMEQLERCLKKYSPDYVCQEKETTIEKWFNSSMAVECVVSSNNYSISKSKYDLNKTINAQLALLLSTSGTTGGLKMVRQSYHNILANARSIIKYLEISIWDRPILSLPISYTYGLSIVHSHIAVGACLFIPSSKIYQKKFWEFCIQKRITSFSGVPYSYEMLDKLSFYQLNTPDLRVMTQAGGKLADRLQRKFITYAKQHHIRFYVMYGQTEATARMSYIVYGSNDIVPDNTDDETLHSSEGEEKIGSIGKAIPGGEMYLKDSENNIITQPYVEGEIIYKGENVSLGYAYNAGDLLIGDENRGILQTGDIGYQDTDGFFYITGRKSRFVKICGKRISLDDVEERIKRTYPDLPCAVVGNDKKIIVYMEKDKTREIKQLLKEYLKLHLTQMETVVLEKLPYSHSGKIAYAMLKQ